MSERWGDRPESWEFDADVAWGWYYRDGTKVSGGYAEVERLLRDPAYKVLRQTVVNDRLWVSTVWLGLDHSYRFLPGADPAPLIFETMVFHQGTTEQAVDSDEATFTGRYPDEAAAVAGHGFGVAWALGQLGLPDSEALDVGLRAAAEDLGELTVDRDGVVTTAVPRQGRLVGRVDDEWHDEQRRKLAEGAEWARRRLAERDGAAPAEDGEAGP